MTTTLSHLSRGAIRALIACALALPSLVAEAQAYTVFWPNKTVYTDKRDFEINVGEILTDKEYEAACARAHTFMVDPKSPFFEKFCASVQRAFNTLESTIANKPSRRIIIQCVFHHELTSPTHATADPWWYDNYKLSDLGITGDYASTKARCTSIDAIWRYNKFSSQPPLYDVQIFYSSNTLFDADKQTFGSFYVEESTEGFSGVDVETVTLHEVGHAIGFYSGYDSGRMSALDVLMTSEPSPLQGGGMEWHFNGEAATAMNGGTRVQLMPGAVNYDPHIRFPRNSTMCDGTQQIGTARRYTDVELAMLQDLGYTLAQPIYLVQTDENDLGTIATNKLAARRGDAVQITATPNNGYKLESISVTCNGKAVAVGNDNTFVMPAGNVNITAQFVPSEATAVDNTTANHIRIISGRVECDEPFRIFSLAGNDVTAANGTLKGIYIVKTQHGAAKVSIR